MAKGGYPGGRMSGGMNMNMLRQAQKMQQEMLRQQQEVEEKTFTATAGGGLAEATVNGKRELVKLTIDPDAVIDAQEPEDAEMLADAVLAAVNEALRKAGEEMASAMSKFTSSLPL